MGSQYWFQNNKWTRFDCVLVRLKLSKSAEFLNNGKGFGCECIIVCSVEEEKGNGLSPRIYTHRRRRGASFEMTKIASIGNTEICAWRKVWNDNIALYTCMYRGATILGLRKFLSRRTYIHIHLKTPGAQHLTLVKCCALQPSTIT